MNQKLFLASMKAFLNNEMLQWEEEVSFEEWDQVFQIANKQNTLAMIYQSTFGCPALLNAVSSEYLKMLKQRTMQDVFLQIRKTQEFLKLYQSLRNNGLEPIVVKGIVCRNLYGNPDNRISGDEDLYIPKGQYGAYRKALYEAGMIVPEEFLSHEEIDYEVSYVGKDFPLLLEIHKSLFAEESDAYAGMNERFAKAFENSVVIEIENVPIRTMGYSDHLLFLILHAYKHFIHSGFGIRQVCDMVMFANAYGSQIDWKFIYDQCKMIHADVFTAALFDIGYQHLNFDPEKACYPKFWQEMEVDSWDLLQDLLDAGVYGDADMSRKHSSNITLNAVMSEKQGKKAKASVLRTLFPPKETIKGRYPWLEKHSFLLPFAWVNRIWHYAWQQKKRSPEDNAAESIKIGGQRVELMKKYKIIK